MKTKLLLQTPAAILLLFAALATPAQSPPGSPPAVNPVTGLPARSGAPAIGPNTGLPAVQPPPKEWIDPNWKDPKKVLPKVDFRQLPISEVVRYLREQFSNDFDIVTPHWYNPTNSTSSEWNINPQTGLPVGPQTVRTIDPQSESVTLQLRNVTASEVFRAMNWQFEAENDPVRWELTMNGHRPTALLRIIPALLSRSETTASPEPKLKRMVFFVGDLLSGKKTGGGSKADQMTNVVAAIAQVWQMSGLRPDQQPNHLQIYAPAQLLIVTGSAEQIDLAKQTLQALKQKAELKPLKPNAAELMPKSGGSGGAK